MHHHHLYAEDTQLPIPFSPSNFCDNIVHLLYVAIDISWMTSNLLALTPFTVEFILVDLRERLKKI